MKRIACLAAVALAALSLAFVPSTPAGATQDVCVGLGVANTPPLYYPGFPLVNTTPASGGFNLSLFLGGCNGTGGVLTGLNASGSLTGFCGQSTGNGAVNGHHGFTYVSAGSMLVLVGSAAGVANAVPDATQGQSCTTGATRFLVTGAVALV